MSVLSLSNITAFAPHRLRLRVREKREKDAEKGMSATEGKERMGSSFCRSFREQSILRNPRTPEL